MSQNDFILRKGNGPFEFMISDLSPLDPAIQHTNIEAWDSRSSSRQFAGVRWEFKPTIKFKPANNGIEFRESWTSTMHSSWTVAAKLCLLGNDFIVRWFGPISEDESRFRILLERHPEAEAFGEIIPDLGWAECHYLQGHMLNLERLLNSGSYRSCRFVCMTFRDYEVNRFFDPNKIHEAIVGDSEKPNNTGDMNPEQHDHQDGVFEDEPEPWQTHSQPPSPSPSLDTSVVRMVDHTSLHILAQPQLESSASEQALSWRASSNPSSAGGQSQSEALRVQQSAEPSSSRVAVEDSVSMPTTMQPNAPIEVLVSRVYSDIGALSERIRAWPREKQAVASEVLAAFQESENAGWRMAYHHPGVLSAAELDECYHLYLRSLPLHELRR